MAKFEFVEKYKDCGLPLPSQATSRSAGWDLAAAENIVIPSYPTALLRDIDEYGDYFSVSSRKLEEVKSFVAEAGLNPTLVPTGVKCQLAEDEFLALYVRSSSPLKYLLILANGVGVIDADYYNNPDNEGHIYLQLINLSPVDIVISKGEKIGQGIVQKYVKLDNESTAKERVGGFGSTDKLFDACM